MEKEIKASDKNEKIREMLYIEMIRQQMQAFANIEQMIRMGLTTSAHSTKKTN